MPAFGKSSRANLSQCHPDLQILFNEVINHFDCSVICGHRNMEDQEKAFADGTTKAHFGESLHNHLPAMAVDVVPYPLNWEDRERFCYLAGHVMATAKIMGINIRWGGDWDKDQHTTDETFSDMPHFELVDY